MNYIFCEQPFIYCEINTSGDVKVCCDKWCNNFSLGNILTSGFEEIFNGEKFQKFIKQFELQKFDICNTRICPLYKTFSKEEFDQKFTRYTKNVIKTIRLNYDSNCNLNCVFCRTSNLAKEQENIQKMDIQIRKMLPFFNQQGWTISLNGVGELFTSKIHLSLIKHIVENYPNIKFAIITNGILFSESTITNLKIEERISTVEVSVHAYNEHTYKSLVKNGDFKRLKVNLAYIKKLVDEKKINNFYMNFVVTSKNYKEMPKFVEWAHSLGACPLFLPLLHINDIKDKIFKKLDITNPEHPKYNDFVEKIKNPIFKQDNVIIPSYYFELEKTKNIFQKLFCK